MTRPSKIKILNFEYSIRWVDDAISIGSEAHGWCDFENQLIVINQDATRQMIAEVFLHEANHALLASLDLMDTPGVDHEQIVSRISTGFCTIWKQNPAAFRWWSNLMK